MNGDFVDGFRELLIATLKDWWKVAALFAVSWGLVVVGFIAFQRLLAGLGLLSIEIWITWTDDIVIGRELLRTAERGEEISYARLPKIIRRLRKAVVSAEHRVRILESESGIVRLVFQNEGDRRLAQTLVGDRWNVWEGELALAEALTKRSDQANQAFIHLPGWIELDEGIGVLAFLYATSERWPDVKLARSLGRRFLCTPARMNRVTSILRKWPASRRKIIRETFENTEVGDSSRQAG